MARALYYLHGFASSTTSTKASYLGDRFRQHAVTLRCPDSNQPDFEDSLRYNPFDATFSQPTLIFHGIRDTSVDPRTVEAFARGRPNITLSLLEDGHQLIASLPRVWDGVSSFLEME